METRVMAGFGAGVLEAGTLHIQTDPGARVVEIDLGSGQAPRTDTEKPTTGVEFNQNASLNLAPAKRGAPAIIEIARPDVKEALLHHGQAAPTAQSALHISGDQRTQSLQSPPPVIAPSATQVLRNESSGLWSKDQVESELEDALSLVERNALPSREASTPLRILGQAAVNRSEQNTAVLRQVADAVRVSPSGLVDIALRPDELGAVRMSLTAVDGQMTVVLQAERSETLDLIRRNIDGLSQEFKELGYDGVSFAFHSGGRRHEEPDGQPREAGERAASPDPTSPVQTSATYLVGTGLDIRI